MSLPRFIAVFALLLLSTVACNQDSSHDTADGSNGGAYVALRAPTQILSVRDIPEAALRLEITYRVGEEITDVEIQRDDVTNDWFGVIELLPGTNVEISVLWSELFRGQLLPLAQQTQTIPIPFDVTEYNVEFPSRRYDSSRFDNDGDGLSNCDGLSNLAERRQDFNPLDPAEPGGPPNDVAVNIRLLTPRALLDANNQPLNLTTVPTVELNGRPVPSLAFDGEAWVGLSSNRENTEAFLSVTFNSETYPDVNLATLQRSENVGNRYTFEVLPDDYNVSFDDDNDGFTNVEELTNGMVLLTI